MHEPLVIAKLFLLAMGLFIAFQAYRGYIRNDSPRMGFLAAGFVLISLGTVLEGLLYELLHVTIYTAGAIQTVIASVGMVLILYSLYGYHRPMLTDHRRGASTNAGQE